MIKKKWTIRKADQAITEILSRELNISPVTAGILATRGIKNAEEGKQYLNPILSNCHPPQLLPDCDKAVKRIIQAIQNKERIFIHGDYDVDGITGCALLTRMLRKLDVEVYPFVPHRFKDGYGVHIDAINTAITWGAKLIITCDCGVHGHEAVQHANQNGIDVVITDHHEPGDTLPDAAAVVNPKRKENQYPFEMLSGSAVAFKVAEAVVEELGLPVDGFRRAYLDLATLGTVADVMPLLGENRILVTYGLKRLMDTKKVGVKALVSACINNTNNGSALTTNEIAFRIGPRLNAAGRIDSASLALELLLTDDLAKANQLVSELELNNNIRRQEQENIWKEALEQILQSDWENKKLLFVAGENWHIGVVGIVAGKITEHFYRPSMVASIDTNTKTARGSARSIKGFNLFTALEANSSHFISCGGHELAAGFSLSSDDLPAVQQALEDYAQIHLPDECLVPEIMIDAELPGKDATLQLSTEINTFQPFGYGNEEPTLLSRNILILSIKPTKDNRHYQLQLRGEAMNPTKAVAFNSAELFTGVKAGDCMDFIYTLRTDNWNGNTTVQWVIQDANQSGD